jgi:GGDEF domain-containing protein
VDELIFTLYGDLELGEVGRRLWEPAIPHLAALVGGAGEAPLLAALEDVARSAGLSRSVPVAVLLDEFARGSKALCDRLHAHGTTEAREVCRLLLGLENVALTRIATGYSAGLEETIDRLRRDAEDASPLDLATGAMKPAEIIEQLSLEVNRCQRMELSLGLLELALDEPAHDEVSSCAPEEYRGMLHEAGECLRENLRRYDSVGLTSDGGFLLVLPDISRRGLAGAAERLRRELAASAGPSAVPSILFALAHYDYVDTNAGEMLESLEKSMRRARVVNEPLAWS